LHEFGKFQIEHLLTRENKLHARMREVGGLSSDRLRKTYFELTPRLIGVAKIWALPSDSSNAR
jgi:hypothetical protein